MTNFQAINIFCERLRESLPITELPITDYQKGFNEAMRIVSENAVAIMTDMTKEIQNGESI